MSRKPLAIDLFCGLGGWTEGLLTAGYNVIGFDIERHQYWMPEVHEESDDGVKNNGYDAPHFRGKAWNGENEKRLGFKDPTLRRRLKEYPAQLVLQDVLTLHGSQFKDAALIVASPPCQKYSWLAMPWSRSTSEHSQAAKALRRKWETEGPDNRLFDACFRIQREAAYARRLELKCCPLDFNAKGCRRCHIPLTVENVRGAQPWVGPAQWSYGSFYLWGDVPALMPITLIRRIASSQRPANCDGVKAQSEGSDYGGGFGWDGTLLRRGNSHSNARKAASAQIAKIPFALAEHIALVYKPREAGV